MWYIGTGVFVNRFHTFTALSYSISKIIRSVKFVQISYTLINIHGIKLTERLKMWNIDLPVSILGTREQCY